MRAFRLLLAVVLLGSAASHAENWFELDSHNHANGLGIEADTDSLRSNDTRRSITVRVSYPEARRHRNGAFFRSAVATVEFTCEDPLAGYRDATYYSEPRARGMVTARDEGRLAAASDATRELLPPSSLELLIRAACSRPATAVP